MKKRIMLLAAVAVVALSFTACGDKDEKEGIAEEETVTTEEEVDEETTDEAETEVSSQEDENETEETTTNAAPAKVEQRAEAPNASEAADSSPVEGVSNAVFTNVSNTVRAQANDSYRNKLKSSFASNSADEQQSINDIDTEFAKWKSLYKGKNDSAFAQTGRNLVLAYSRLAALDNVISGNESAFTADQLSEYESIAFDLQGNTEIFLNTDNIADISNEEDFACLTRIAKLRSTADSAVKSLASSGSEQAAN